MTDTETVLDHDQQVRAEALSVARSIVVKRGAVLAGGAAEVTVGINDIVDLALYIVDGKLPWSDIYTQPTLDESADDLDAKLRSEVIP